jgi:N,N'-diacetylchitobiose phosphorylase
MLTPVMPGIPVRREQVERYKVEPYVVAADVYGAPPHVGRGGWTWYTGSAGWMFRVAVESVLGLTLRDGEAMVLRPCIPEEWPGFRLRYRLPDGATVYDIEVRNRRAGDTCATLDGEPIGVAEGAVVVPLSRDGREHRVEVELGSDVRPRYEPRLAG